MALRLEPLPPSAREPIDVEDADAFDLLHRLDALAHDALDPIEQTAAEQRVTRLVGEDVLGLVEQPLRLRLDGGAHALGRSRDALLLGLLLGDHHLDGAGAAWRSRSRARCARCSSASAARALAFSASTCAADCSSDFW